MVSTHVYQLMIKLWHIFNQSSEYYSEVLAPSMFSLTYEVYYYSAAVASASNERKEKKRKKKEKEKK